jgi:death on curing protein
MADPSSALAYPTLEDILTINRRQIAEYGGHWVEPDNLRYPGGLLYALDAIKNPIFGAELYPGLVEKAARLTYTIICGHVFWDGCKRTGIMTLCFFAELNGYAFEASDKDYEDLALALASGTMSESELLTWLRKRFVFHRNRDS